MRSKRKVRVGCVASISGEKTISVTVQRKLRHKTYNKIVRVSKKYSVHNENSDIVVGDTVEIMETRPISKTKRWRVTSVVRKEQEAVTEA